MHVRNTRTMLTSEGIKPAAKRIKRLHTLSGIKYQQLQAQKSRSKLDGFRRHVAILLYSSLILCLIAIIFLGLLLSIFGLAKAEKDIVVFGNDTTLYNKGLALLKLDNYTGAIKYYDKALAINPKNVNALTDKGLALDNLGNHTGAIKYYDKALAINPKNVNALTDKGLALDNLGNHTGAIKYYDKALAMGIDPHDVRALTKSSVIE
jgi:tetratricopeptide (TPR) repeat protein